jgi:hypothetical protein
MEMNTFVTTAFEVIQARQTPSHDLLRLLGQASFLHCTFATEIEGEAPLIAVMESFDA